MPNFEAQVRGYAEQHRADIESIIDTEGDAHPIIDLYAALEERLSNVVLEACFEDKDNVSMTRASEMKKLNIEMAAILLVINELCDDISSNSAEI